MQFELNHDKRDISNDDLLADLRDVATNHAEESLKQRIYKEHGKYGVTTVIRRFGSWNSAVTAAGLTITVERNIPNDVLFSALFDLWLSLGRQPNYQEVQMPACKFHVATFERRFGSWRKALEAFVLFANSEDLDAPQEVRTNVTKRRTSRSPDLRLRFKVLKRDHFRCCACGVSPATTPDILLELDHILPWSKGGETVFENLQTLCLECNQGKSNISDALLIEQLEDEIDLKAYRARRNEDTIPLEQLT